MPFQIPAIKDMAQRARNAFRAEMPGTDAWIWPNNVYVSAKVIGGAVWEVFGRLKWMDRQRFALTATGYELDRHGLDYGIGRKGKSYAQGNVVVSVDTFPFEIPSGTIFTRSDGASFTSTRAAEVGQFSLTATVPVVADVAGRSGNTIYGAPLSTTLSGVQSASVDDVGLGQGADQETDDQLRARILHRKRYPPHGGAASDYIGWGLELPGVTRVFVKGNAFGRGTVGVWFLMDDNYVAGIPLQADVDAVQAHIDSVAPVTAIPIVQAPIADCVDIQIRNLNPDTQAVREAVAAELQSLFRRTAVVSVPDDPFILYQSQLWQAIANATGERSHQLVAPSTDVTFAPGTMPCLRSVTFLP
jgi:uncharacterized phage protein gp47/JayE